MTYVCKNILSPDKFLLGCPSQDGWCYYKYLCLNGENGFIIKSELAVESCTVAKW